MFLIILYNRWRKRLTGSLKTREKTLQYACAVFVFIFSVIVALSRHASLNPCSFAHRNPCDGVSFYWYAENTTRTTLLTSPRFERDVLHAYIMQTDRPTDRQTDEQTDPNLVLTLRKCEYYYILQPYSSYNIALL